LEPAAKDSLQDFRIHPVASPEFAICVNNPGGGPIQQAPLNLDFFDQGQVWLITPIANPPYFFILEGSYDLLMDVPNNSGGDGVTIQVFTRTENQNQQWTFMPAFPFLADLG
jgi:hypothetical protein